MEDLAFDGPALHDDADVALERVDPRLQERMDRRRDHDLAVAAVLADHREHLLDVERVARRRGGDPLTELGSSGASSGSMSSAHSLGTERLEEERGRVHLPPPQSVPMSRSSVRATQRRKIGASRESRQCARRDRRTRVRPTAGRR
jgi:hypothetical protein